MATRKKTAKKTSKKRCPRGAPKTAKALADKWARAKKRLLKYEAELARLNERAKEAKACHAAAKPVDWDFKD